MRPSRLGVRIGRGLPRRQAGSVRKLPPIEDRAAEGTKLLCGLSCARCHQLGWAFSSSRPQNAIYKEVCRGQG